VKCSNSIHRLVVHTQTDRLQKQNHNRPCLVPSVCISSLSLAQRSERKSGYQCLSSCLLTSGLEVEIETARGTQKMGPVHFIILDHGCATMIVPVKPTKVHKGWTFLTRGHHARGSWEYCTFATTMPRPLLLTKAFASNIGKIGIYAVCLSAAYILVRVVGDRICGWRIKALCDSTVGSTSELGVRCIGCLFASYGHDPPRPIEEGQKPPSSPH
jgi:hypothetical protein